MAKRTYPPEFREHRIALARHGGCARWVGATHASPLPAMGTRMAGHHMEDHHPR